MAWTAPANGIAMCQGEAMLTTSRSGAGLPQSRSPRSCASTRRGQRLRMCAIDTGSAGRRLQVQGQVRRRGRARCATAEGTGGRERSAEEAAGRRRSRRSDDAELLWLSSHPEAPGHSCEPQEAETALCAGEASGEASWWPQAGAGDPSAPRIGTWKPRSHA